MAERSGYADGEPCWADVVAPDLDSKSHVHLIRLVEPADKVVVAFEAQYPRTHNATVAVHSSSESADVNANNGRSIIAMMKAGSAAPVIIATRHGQSE